MKIYTREEMRLKENSKGEYTWSCVEIDYNAKTYEALIFNKLKEKMIYELEVEIENYNGDASDLLKELEIIKSLDFNNDADCYKIDRDLVTIDEK